MTNITDELANWVLRINALCAEKDAEIERLRAALKPFADDARHYAAYPEHMENSMMGGMFTLKQLRAAARALEQ